jgi:hypothetical protein
MSVEARERQLANLKPYQPGQSGNPNGRPKGTRQAFSAGFFADLAEVWAQEGRAAMLATAKTQPSVFLGIASRLIPQQVAVELTSALPGNLSAADWALMMDIVEAVKTALPDAAQRSPSEVLALVQNSLAAALTQHGPKA